MTTLLDFALHPAKGGARQCGPGRQEGHIYAECGFAQGAPPIESFLYDFPVPINPVKAGLSAQGVTLIERQGVWHVIDIVGEIHYRSPADFIEEARVMGISRKLARTVDFSKLSAQSTMIFVHAKAYVTNAAELAPFAPHFRCPCGKPHTAAQPCAGYHWVTPEPTLPNNRRKLVSTTYTVHPLLSGAAEPTYTHAYFMAVPISNLSVVRRKDGHVDPLSRAQANKARLPIIDVSH